MEEYMGQKLNFEIHNGYTPVSGQDNESLFYTMITKVGETLDNMSRDTPVFFWLDGGPGASSQLEMYNEVGPFKLEKNQDGKIEIILKDILWNSKVLLILMDQPLNVGFSYSKNTRVKSSKEVAKYFKVFLQNFYKRYEHLVLNPTYIFGVSYGGHYVPAITYMILKENPVEKLNFKGIGIGDGMIDLKIQLQTYGSYGENMSIFSHRQKQYSQGLQNYALQMYAMKKYRKVTDIFQLLAKLPGQLDVYNTYYYEISGQEDPNLNLELYPELLNDKNFRKNVYGIPDFIPQFQFLNFDVYSDFWEDIPISLKPELEYILDSGINVVMYEGQLDYVINSPGYQNLVNELQWKYSQYWYNSERNVWYKYGSDKYVFGNYQSYENFAYVNVYKAGHGAFCDQPQAGIEMLNKYLDWDWS